MFIQARQKDLERKALGWLYYGLRKKTGQTQTQLGSSFGQCPQMISNYEKGRGGNFPIDLLLFLGRQNGLAPKELACELLKIFALMLDLELGIITPDKFMEDANTLVDDILKDID